VSSWAVYLADGALKSTTPDGSSTINEHTWGLVTAELQLRATSYAHPLVEPQFAHL
jgi:hypothetical protein